MTDRKTGESLARLKNTLSDTIDFLEEAIREDLEELKDYKKFHGDLKYRPSLGPGQWGAATDTVLEPLASKYRTTVKTLVDTIAVIEGKIIVGEPFEAAAAPEKDEEGPGTGWDAKEALRKAKEEAAAKKQKKDSEE